MARIAVFILFVRESDVNNFRTMRFLKYLQSANSKQTTNDIAEQNLICKEARKLLLTSKTLETLN